MGSEEVWRGEVSPQGKLFSALSLLTLGLIRGRKARVGREKARIKGFVKGQTDHGDVQSYCGYTTCVNPIRLGFARACAIINSPVANV